MAFSQATLVKRIRARLNDDPWHDVCTEAMDTTEVGLDVADGTKYTAGDIVEFQDDGELCLVQSVSSNTLTVIRNYAYSVTATAGTGTSHSSGCDITKNPVYQYSQITQAVTEVIADLWPYVYTLEQQSVTPSATESYYGLTSTILDISSVYQLSTSTPDAPQFYGQRRSGYPAEIVFNLSTGFSQSTPPSIWIPSRYNTTNAIVVNGIRKIVDATGGSYADLVEGPPSETVMLFAIAELFLSTDIIRSTGEDVSMNDQSVTPGSRSGIAEQWRRKGLRARRQWEQDLRTTLPRKPVYNAIGSVRN